MLMSQTLRIYIARHGDASLSKKKDSLQPLSARGVEEVEKIALWASLQGIQVEQIHHSGIQRAQESAEIFAKFLHPKSGVLSVSGLMPSDSARAMAADLTHETRTLLLVGHLPFMGLLAEELIRDNEKLRSVGFPTGGLAGFEYDGKSWTLICTITPDKVKLNSN